MDNEQVGSGTDVQTNLKKATHADAHIRNDWPCWKRFDDEPNIDITISPATEGEAAGKQEKIHTHLQLIGYNESRWFHKHKYVCMHTSSSDLSVKKK